MFRKLLYRAALLRIACALLVISCVVISIVVSLQSNLQSGKFCFQAHKQWTGQENFVVLNDIMEDSKLPTPGKTIFFHETSCSKNYPIRLNSRQACAIESAAKLNADWDVFVLFPSPVALYNSTELNDDELMALLEYPNIHFRNVDIWNYARSTPIYDFIQDGNLFSSQYMNSHLSDYLRYLTLYNFGGIYLDLDVIVKAHFSDLPPNFAGAESSNYIAAGIISLDKKEVGSVIAEMLLEDFKLNFNGMEWGNNGPGVITRVLHKLCQTRDPRNMMADRCRGFRVLPIDKCYAVGWQNWRQFFSKNNSQEVLHKVHDSIIVHVWNKHSSKEIIIKGDDSAYDKLAKQFCPKVYATKDSQF